MSGDELKVRALNKAEFRKMERKTRTNGTAGHPPQTEQGSGDPLLAQQHDMVSSNQ
jgi:hypothetical protein